MAHCTETAQTTAPACATTGSAPQQAHIDIAQLCKEHRRNLLRFVQRYVRNPDDAEDVVQGAFLEAHRFADRFSGLSKPSTWLFGIAYNLARNQIRRNVDMKYDEVDEEFMEQIADAHTVNPEEIVDLKQRVGRIHAAFSTLPAKFQDTFESVFDGESTYEEAAEKLNVPIGTIRSRVSRLRAAMRAECR